MGLALYPGIQNSEIFPHNTPISCKNPVAVLQSEGSYRLIQHAAADMVIITVGEKLLHCVSVMGSNPAKSQPCQGKHLGHAAD